MGSFREAAARRLDNLLKSKSSIKCTDSPLTPASQVFLEEKDENTPPRLIVKNENSLNVFNQ